MMKTLLTLTLAASVAASFAAAAGVRNPDNDSGTYFANIAAAAPAARSTAAGVPANGAISDDGLYVWKNADKGWVARGHSFVFTANGVEHAPNCLAYNLPKPTAGRTPTIGKGS